MKKNLFTSFFALLFIFVGQGMHAQTVNGTVSSDDGPLPGASVVVKGTGVGTTTDFDGNFSIETSNGDVLEVSFVGFSTQEITVSGQDQIVVFLETDNELEEVVVTGYGSQREKEITASVVKVEAEDFNQGAINDASQLLQGKVAGLQIYNRGGNPNAAATIRLRGISTVGANT
ncbi:MAG: carboxypeptidase-like regulatory domain-containing protein, partial [Flavobacteriaceae bacterium]